MKLTPQQIVLNGRTIDKSKIKSIHDSNLTKFGLVISLTDGTYIRTDNFNIDNEHLNELVKKHTLNFFYND